MKRFTLEHTGRFDSVAVIVNDAIGNFVVSTPLLQKIHKHWQPSRLTFFGGQRTEAFQNHCELLTESVLLFGKEPCRALDLCRTFADEFDIVVNLESQPLAKQAGWVIGGNRALGIGRFMDPMGGSELAPSPDPLGDFIRYSNWMDPATLAKLPEVESPFIGEIFVRMCGLNGPIPPYQLPWQTVETDLPRVWISTSASLDCKLWPLSHWVEVGKLLQSKGIKPGILGAPRSLQASWKGWDSEDELIAMGLADDWRGKLSLLEVVGALRNSDLTITIDNGIGHIAAAARCPEIVLYREGIHRLWAPPVPTLFPLFPSPGQAVDSIGSATVCHLIDQLLPVKCYA